MKRISLLFLMLLSISSISAKVVTYYFNSCSVEGKPNSTTKGSFMLTIDTDRQIFTYKAKLNGSASWTEAKYTIKDEDRGESLDGTISTHGYELETKEYLYISYYKVKKYSIVKLESSIGVLNFGRPTKVESK